MDSIAYSSSIEFQQRIVAAIARDSLFFRAYFNCIDASYFTQESHKTIITNLLSFTERHGRLPDKVELEHFVLEHIKQTTNNTNRYEQLVPVYKRDIEDLFAIPSELLETAKEYAVDFAKQAAFKNALVESARSVAKLDTTQGLEFAQQRLSKAAQVGLNLDDFGIDYFRSVKERISKRFEVPLEAMRVPFLIPKLDSAIGGIGFRKNGGVPEMLIFMAPTNRGKSRALAHMAKVAVSLGLKVALFTAEMAAELYAERLDMSIAGLTTEQLYDAINIKRTETKIDLIKQQGGGLFIKKYPSRQATIAQTVALLHRMKTAINFKPDLVIYDYIDEFAPPANGSDERRHDLSAITSAMRAVGDEFGCGVATATQTNRDALSKDTFDIQHIAEDIGKANIADIIIAICQSKEEESKEIPEQRFVVVKNRSRPKGLTVRIVDDVMRMRLRQHDEESMADSRMPGVVITTQDGEKIANVGTVAVDDITEL